ncbi:hypothetical protein [Thiobacillus sp.]|uniref:hypothetical protein n=1 Tax=Thiobacillus sp. TaxID=924 RepID=UPI0011DC53F1|nr:hypothetical protein [Thiobacillus sp.]TXH76820.1 MAG: hypothetical protein E6Q82_01665 [Thiobacillus sp.]
MSGRFYQTQFYLDQLKPLMDGKIIGLLRSGEDELGDEFYGLSIQCKDGATRRLIFLSDDEGNGPGSFEITEGV